MKILKNWMFFKLDLKNKSNFKKRNFFKMPLRIVLAKQVLERKILLDLMIQKYKVYDNWLSRFYNISSIGTALIATIAESIGTFDSAPILLVATAVTAFTITKIRDMFNLGTIINRCKEQLVKYETLYQKILVIITDSQIESVKETFSSLKDFDVEIDREIIIKFNEECKKNGIKSASNDVDKLKTLDEFESSVNANGLEQSKLSIEEIMNNSVQKNSEIKLDVIPKEENEDDKEEENKNNSIKSNSIKSKDKQTDINQLSLFLNKVSTKEKKNELANQVQKINIDKDLKESLERFSNISSISLERLEKIKNDF